MRSRRDRIWKRKVVENRTAASNAALSETRIRPERKTAHTEA